MPAQTDVFEPVLSITKNGKPFATYAWHAMDRTALQAFQRAVAEALMALGDAHEDVAG